MSTQVIYGLACMLYRKHVLSARGIVSSKSCAVSTANYTHKTVVSLSFLFYEIHLESKTDPIALSYTKLANINIFWKAYEIKNHHLIYKQI